MVQQKIQAFRDFASQLASQVVEQLCVEYEREMSQMWNDLLMYRNELDRVAQLLGSQLEREKKLHGVIEQMVGHSAGVHEQAKYMASQQPQNSGQLHQWLEQFMGQHADILNQTVTGVGQANQVLMGHAANANQMKQEAITAENEFMRIVNLLRQPLVSNAMPAPTVAAIPGSVKFNQSGMYGSPPPSGALTPGPPMGPPMGGSPGGFPQQRAPYVVMQAQPQPRPSAVFQMPGGMPGGMGAPM